MAVEAASIVVGGAMVIVSWPASAVDPEPITLEGEPPQGIPRGL